VLSRRHPGQVVARLAPALVAAVLLAAALPGPAARAAVPGPAVTRAPTYDWPVPGPVVVAFDLSGGAYGAGHRGVDLAVEPGQAVHAMATGMVTWSGAVAGDSWVTVMHADGVRTSYGPLRATARLHVGTPVDRGDVLGHARGDAHGTPGRVHVGARRASRYVDPAALVDRTALVATLVGPGEVAVDPPASTSGSRPLVPGTPPSPNHLVVLAGLTSHTGGQPFALADLGYGTGTWQQYSYAGTRGDGTPRAYDHRATWGRVHDMAVALRDQLRAHADRHPGQAVDLLGHSLGGLVGVYYLLVLHDPTDPTLPPIGKVVTVASPLGGADSANAVGLARRSLVGRALLDLAEARWLTPATGDGPVMHDGMPVLEDLGTSSPVVRAVAEAWARHRDDPWSGPLATGTDVLTIGSTLDPIVNEHRSGLPGAEHRTLLDPDLLDAHRDVTRDDRTEQLLAAHLAGEPLPARGIGGALVAGTAGIGSSAVAAVEYALAAGTWALDGLLDGP
jgi:hypothetical protein